MITVSKNMANHVLFVFKHELTHSIEGTQEYAKLQNQILKSPELLNFAREQGATIGELARAKLLSYAEKGVELTAPEAMHEVVADYIGSNLFTDEKSIMTLAREN
ncbi:hypothetical protein [Acidaminobacterium chupaoyuni]